MVVLDDDGLSLVTTTIHVTYAYTCSCVCHLYVSEHPCTQTTWICIQGTPSLLLITRVQTLA